CRALTSSRISDNLTLALRLAAKPAIPTIKPRTPKLAAIAMRRRAFPLALRTSNRRSSACCAAIATKFSRYWRMSTVVSDTKPSAGKGLLDRPSVSPDELSERWIKGGYNLAAATKRHARPCPPFRAFSGTMALGASPGGGPGHALPRMDHRQCLAQRLQRPR